MRERIKGLAHRRFIPMPGFLDLKVDTHIIILTQHSFYGILQHPLAAMACVDFHGVFRRERAAGRMKLPDMIVYPGDRDGVPEACARIDGHQGRLVMAYTTRYSPEDGVVAILPDYRSGNGHQTPVPGPHTLSGDRHKYFVGIGSPQNLVKAQPTVFDGPVTCAGFSFQAPAGDSNEWDGTINAYQANAVTVGKGLGGLNGPSMIHEPPRVTLLHCEATKAKIGVAICDGADAYLRHVTMQHNIVCGLEVHTGMSACVIEDCLIRSNGENVGATHEGPGMVAGFSPDGVPFPTAHFKNCVIGGYPLQNYNITPFLVNTDQLDQVTFTVEGAPNDQPENWARPDNLQHRFASDKCYKWEGFRSYYDDAILSEKADLSDECFTQLAANAFRTSVTLQQCIEMVRCAKAEGTELMKDAFLRQAAAVYVSAGKHALLFTDLSKLESPEKCDEYKVLICAQVACLNNAALCMLKMTNWTDAKRICDIVLEQDPLNVKALFRRSQASIEQGNHEEAEATLRRAINIDPEETSVARLLASCTKEKRRQQAKAKKTFSAMFA